MAFSELFINFLTILKESIKLLPKNGKLMALIAICSMIINSCIFLLLNYSLQSLLKDMFTAIMQYIIPDPAADPNTDFDPAKAFALFNNLRQYLALMFTVEIAAVLISLIISFFFAIAIILVSAYSYNEATLSINEMFAILKKTWTRPLITTLYVFGLAMGYFFVVLELAIPLLMLYPNRAAISIAVVFLISASLLYFYIVVTWTTAVVVSVVEERCYGIEALRRGATLVKGNKLQGFLLNFSFNLVGVIIFEGFTLMLSNKVLVMYPTLCGLLVVNLSALLKIWFLVAYTVLYFHCKKHHGEEIGLHESLEYTKLPTTLLANDV